LYIYYVVTPHRNNRGARGVGAGSPNNYHGGHGHRLLKARGSIRFFTLGGAQTWSTVKNHVCSITLFNKIRAQRWRKAFTVKKRVVKQFY